jgi:alkylation response protein AidB-like acyl-CoA dehydrogenase
VKPQAGISFLLIDLNSPGVKVRPIRTLDGGCDLNEVFLDDVRVPRANLIGEPNKGWTYAKHLLGFERTGIAGVGATKQQLMRLRRFATHAVRAGRPVAEDPVFVRRLADLEIDALALEYTVLKMMTERGGGALGVEASMLKVRGTELRQAVFELLMDVGGPQAARGLGAADPEPELDEFALRAAALTGNYFDSRKLSIYGGANEIQRNVLAKGVLEL